ncbi:DUF5679 domain-containing protein [Chloroflexota bacterium]
MQAYCIKCNAKREIIEANSAIMKDGRLGTQGICAICGTKMFKIGPAKVSGQQR